jgi:hypothetical protein
MNSFVPDSYLENLRHLAMGFEPVDALRRTRIAHPIRIDIEHPRRRSGRREPYRHVIHPGSPRPVISRYDSCRHVLLYHPALGNQITVVLFDHERQFVPRRMQIPIEVLARAEAAPFDHRLQRPVLFPGAAYDIIERSTGLRGRVTRDGNPMRWARVEAQVPGTGAVVGRAHGDDRGEFLLVIASHTFGGLSDPFDLRVVIAGPGVQPTPDTPQQPAENRFWDLPREVVPAAGAPDPVSSGQRLPTDYVEPVSSTRMVPFQLGRIISRIHGVEDFVFSP